jgi:DNA polymerase-3 subunit beta
MNLTVSRKALADALTWVAQALPKNAQVSATAGTLLTADERGLSLSAFDFDRSHRAVVEADVTEQGQALASGRFLATVVAGLRGDTVTLAIDGRTLTVTSGRSQYRTQLMEIEDYPSLPQFPAPVGTIADHRLDWLLRTTAGVTSDTAGEYNTGIHLEADERGLWAVGADGGSTATRSIHIAVAEDWSGSPFDVTVPAGSIGAAMKGLAGQVEVAKIDGLLGLRDASRTVTMRTFSAPYLRGRWRQVAAAQVAKAEHYYTVEAPELADAVKRAGALSDDRDAMHVELGFGLTDIAVSGAGGIGQGVDYVAASGEDEVRVAVNASLLAKALTAAGDRPIRIGVPSGMGAITIRPHEGDDALFVVMPRKLREGK